MIAKRADHGGGQEGEIEDYCFYDGLIVWGKYGEERVAY